jgi:nitrogen regulatory protein P-II 1
MIRFVAYVRPHRLEAAKTAIAALGVSGMTVADSRGCGNSAERSRWLDGEEVVVALPIRSRLEVFAQDDLAEALIEATIEAVRSGEAGDGKIFVFPIENAIRVRTGERGDNAL